jgi:phosphate transport system protein
MKIKSESINQHHILQPFDGELNLLNNLLMAMGRLVLDQVRTIMQAVADGDLQSAEYVRTKDQEVDRLEIRIDAGVLDLLVRHNPVAGDLRTVVSTAKLAVELEKMGNEIADFAKLTGAIFAPNSRNPNVVILRDIVKIGTDVQLMLEQLCLILETRAVESAYSLLQAERDCQRQFQQGVKHQLRFAVEDARLIGRALDLLEMIKTLEQCAEHCRNCAEYLIFMIEGVDVRHLRDYPSREYA